MWPVRGRIRAVGALTIFQAEDTFNMVCTCHHAQAFHSFLELIRDSQMI